MHWLKALNHGQIEETTIPLQIASPSAQDHYAPERARHHCEIERMLGGFLDGPVDGVGRLAGCRRSRAMPEASLLRISDRVTTEGNEDVFLVVEVNTEAQPRLCFRPARGRF